MFNLLQQQVPQQVEVEVSIFERYGHSISMFVLTILLCGICMYYKSSIAKCSAMYQEMPKFTFLIFISIQWIRKLTYQILGKSYRVFVPFFIYIFFFLWFSGLITILGFKPMGGSILVPITLSTVVLLGTLASGIFYRGFRYFGDYMVWIKWRGRKIIPIVDPLKLIGEMSKIVSLTCRLWGNTLAGSLIIFVVYAGAEKFLSGANILYLGPTIIPLFVFPLHIYFDIIGASLHPLIYLMLTMCYWSIAKQGESVQPQVGYDIEPERDSQPYGN